MGQKNVENLNTSKHQTNLVFSVGFLLRFYEEEATAAASILFFTLLPVIVNLFLGSEMRKLLRSFSVSVLCLRL